MTGWAKLTAFILAYEVRHSCDGKLLSEEADRWIAKRPVLARVVIGAVGLALTAHVGNFLPRNADFLARAFWDRPIRAIRAHF
ncbi:hypothetical protein [Mycobacterium phage WXIN]|nr:hypothetical protein [Mycobacterium phage WXIN]